MHEAEVLQSEDQSLGEAVRQPGVSDAKYYKWRKEYEGLRVDQAKRFKELDAENQADEIEEMDVSEQRACRVLEQPRST